MTPWHDNDAFWAETAGFLFNKQRLEGAAKDVEQLMSLIARPAGAAVLDLCCGVGRHSLELARRGYRVTGVDRSGSYLSRAREAASRDGLQIEWVQADMREFRRPGAFDAVVNLLTSFGYFDDPEADRTVLGNVHASLRPGGGFVLDIMPKEVLARIFRERDWHEEPDGGILLEERKVRDGWQWLDVRWITLRGRERAEHRFSLRLYSATELAGLIESVGFADVRAYGALDGRPYDQGAERLVLVANKPG